jgi:hypothetical protein
VSIDRLKSRRGAALLAVIVAVAIVLAVVLTRPKSTPVATNTTASTPAPAPAAGKGFALVDGAYVAPPYTVSLAGDDIALNGKVVDSVAGPATATPAPVAATNADGVVLLGESHWPANETLTDQQRADMVAFLQSQPATAQVTVGDADLIVTDKSGASALLPLSRRIPDPTAQHQARQTLVAEWSALLDSGGLLMTGPGATVEVAGTTGPAVLDAIAKAFAQGGADLEQRLEQITGAPPVAQALARVGKPPKSLLNRVSAAGAASRAPQDPTVQLAAARQSLPSAADTASAVHTPRSSKAYVFDYFGEGDDDAMRTAALDQGYTLVRFKIGGERYPPGQNSIENFHSMARNGGAGLLYIATHGQGPTLTFDDATEGRHLSRSDVRSHWTDVSGIVFLAACHGFGMEDAFAGGDLIGQPMTSVSCEQASQLAQEFWPRLDGTKDDGTKRKARDAFSAAAAALAYPSGAVAPVPTTTLASPPGALDTTLEVADASGAVVGQQVFAFHNEPDLLDEYKYLVVADVTAVDVATGTITIKYRRGSFSGDVGPLHFFDLAGTVSPRPGTAHEVMRPFVFRGAGQTVLAPSVPTPPASAPVELGVESPQTVSFDAAVDTTVAPSTAITAAGPCAPEIVSGSARWSGDRSLRFSFKAHQAGAATFHVLGRKVRSAGNGTLLDGNTKPVDRNRVGPAGDDFTWTVECGASGVPQRISDTDIHSNCFLDPIPNQAGRCSVPWPAVEITTGSTLVMTTAPDGLVISDRCSDPQITITVEGAGVRTGPLSAPATFDFGTVPPGKHKVTMTFAATCQPRSPDCAKSFPPPGLDCNPAMLRFNSLLLQYRT